MQLPLFDPTPIVSAERIRRTIDTLACTVYEDYCRSSVKSITLVTVLEGALIFSAGFQMAFSGVHREHMLVRSALIHPHKNGGGMEIISPIQRLEDIRGAHVLVLDDIITTGEKLQYVGQTLHEFDPASLNAVVLLSNKPGTIPHIKQGAYGHFDEFYVGISLEGKDQAYVGYGLALGGDRFRGLNGICSVTLEQAQQIREHGVEKELVFREAEEQNKKHPAYPGNLGDVVYTHREITDNICGLAGRIYRNYADRNVSEVRLVEVLKGATPFRRELMEALRCETLKCGTPITFSLDSIRVRFDPFEIIKDLNYPVAHHHVLLADDTVNTGATGESVTQLLTARGAKDVRVAALIDKPAGRKNNFKPHFAAFTYAPGKERTGTELLVGFGMDPKPIEYWGDDFRKLPSIHTYRPSPGQPLL